MALGRTIGFIGLFIGVAVGYAHAAPPALIVFDNRTATSDGTDGVASAGDNGAGPLAQSFSTGDAPFDLSDLSLGLASAAGAVQSGGAIAIDILADDSVSPGSTVVASFGTMLDSSLTATPVFYDFTLSTPVALTADTRYWVELTADPTLSSIAVWSYALDVSGPGVSTEYTFNNYNDDGSPGVADATGGLYQMCVSDTAGTCAVDTSSQGPSGPSPPSPPSSPDPVPEPAGSTLLGVGLAALTRARHRRG